MGSSGEYERGRLPSQRMRRRAIAQSVGERVEEAGAVARLPHLQTGRMTGRMTGGMTGGMTGRTTGRNDGPGGLLGRAARRACAHLCACALVRLCVRACVPCVPCVPCVRAAHHTCRAQDLDGTGATELPLVSRGRRVRVSISRLAEPGACSRLVRPVALVAPGHMGWQQPWTQGWQRPPTHITGL